LAHFAPLREIVLIRSFFYRGKTPKAKRRHSILLSGLIHPACSLL